MVNHLSAKPNQAQLRGTLVHSVLEHLFDSSGSERTNTRAEELLVEQWGELKTSNEDTAVRLFPDDAGEDEFLGEARRLISNYFILENPQLLTPSHREFYVRDTLDSGLRVHGVIDRVEISSDGQVRIVDYKTGKAPSERFLSPLVFQIRFYSLLWYRLYDTLPKLLQLEFLGDAKVFSYEPSTPDLQRVTLELEECWGAIRTAITERVFEPRTSKLCDWCDFRELCPAFGGQAPEIDEEGLEKLSSAGPMT